MATPIQLHPLRERLPRFLLLYVAAYAAFGVSSPFFPAFLKGRGVSATQLGLALGAATAVRLVTAPLAARLAEVRDALHVVLVASIALAAAVTLGFWPVHGFWPLLALTLLQAATLAPITVLSDALTLAHARRAPDEPGFDYGWVRGAGSAAFVVGMLLAGQAVAAHGLKIIILLQAGLLAATTLVATVVPRRPPSDVKDACGPPPVGGAAALARIAPLRRLVLAAALVLGAHAMHDAFAVIRWTSAGMGAETVSVLWAESVIGEVVVFFVVGPALLARIGPAGGIAVAAIAGVVRWTVLGATADVHLLAIVEPLHGLTFALFHLAAMRLVTRIAPGELRATALAIYGTVGIGTATALLTLASGELYARLGAHGFWAMAALSALAVPVAATLREPAIARACDDLTGSADARRSTTGAA